MKRDLNAKDAKYIAKGQSLCVLCVFSFAFKRSFSHWHLRIMLALTLVVSLVCGGCFLDTEVEPFYGHVNVPRAQEFRWSDGGLPRTFDPALAAAPPDTDAVRAIFEGLTEYDPKTLLPVPGVAARWESSADGREWTFYLRRDARWTNGEPVTARDFVRSWQRTLQFGERAPHANLLENIVGAGPVIVTITPPPSEEPQPSPRRPDEKKEERQETKKDVRPTQPEPRPPTFGAQAVDDYTLRVRLQRPDMNFPALVAHPVFRPVHNADDPLSTPSPAVGRIISNGAFQLSKTGGDGVVLERASNYWDAQTVSLQRVQFVATRDTEDVLASYRTGDVDVVTNAPFEPLAVKLLVPYKDFRRATYGALTYYTFNTAREPFNDVRVREALAISIDRERICEDEMGGATEPAKRFLPTQTFIDESSAQPDTKPGALEQDRARAQSLLAEAGYPQGKGLRPIRLLVNRNDPQRLVAQSVAQMWHSVLGVETDIVVKNWDEYEADIRAGEYDVARRGLVMQTTDEETNMRIMFEQSTPEPIAPQPESTEPAGETTAATDQTPSPETGKQETEEKPAQRPTPPPPVLSEAQALKELPAMPIYFASSYALVKPYVVGFDSNLLDAPSLKHVRIDTSWQHPKQATLVWFQKME